MPGQLASWGGGAWSLHSCDPQLDCSMLPSFSLVSTREVASTPAVGSLVTVGDIMTESETHAVILLRDDWSPKESLHSSDYLPNFCPPTHEWTVYWAPTIYRAV